MKTGTRLRAMDNGYWMHERVFDPAEMATAVTALAQADMVRTKAGARHVLAVPAVRALATDPRMTRLAAEFVGAAPIAFRATLFDKSPTSNWLVVWHQDTALPMKNHVDDPAWVSWSMKAGVRYAHAPAWALETIVALRLIVDDSTATNGPLRVLPDTHRKGVLTDEELSSWRRRSHRSIVSPLPAASSRCARSPSMLPLNRSTTSSDACCTLNTRRRWTSAQASSSPSAR